MKRYVATAGLELARLLSLVLCLGWIPVPRSETNDAFVSYPAFAAGAFGLVTFMLATCLIAARTRIYGLVSTAAQAMIFIAVAYLLMDYWRLIR